MITPGSWAGRLPWGEKFRAGLAYYPPGLSQSAHSHRVPHASIVIAGSFRETTPAGDRIVCQGSVGFRADEARHAVSFGPAGALILTVENHDWVAEGGPKAGVCWLGASVPFARELVGLARSGDENAAAQLGDRLLDLWASRPGRELGAAGPPPAWLEAAAERLLAAPEECSIGGLARRLGVHRVHFARCFLRYYGMPASVFRRRAMASRALSAALVAQSRLAHAAAEAGFADQSHMARTVRDSCAMGVGEIRRLLTGEVTSIQSRPASHS